MCFSLLVFRTRRERQRGVNGLHSLSACHFRRTSGECSVALRHITRYQLFLCRIVQTLVRTGRVGVGTTGLSGLFSRFLRSSFLISLDCKVWEPLGRGTPAAAQSRPVQLVPAIPLFFLVYTISNPASRPLLTPKLQSDAIKLQHFKRTPSLPQPYSPPNSPAPSQSPSPSPPTPDEPHFSPDPHPHHHQPSTQSQTPSSPHQAAHSPHSDSSHHPHRLP